MRKLFNATILFIPMLCGQANAEKPLEERPLCEHKYQAVNRIDHVRDAIRLGRPLSDLEICQAGSKRYELIDQEYTDVLIPLIGTLFGRVVKVTLQHKDTGDTSIWYVTTTGDVT